MVARNWRSRGRKGEIDLIGWDGGVLCFIEVKTRSSHAVAPAEAAVDRAKQRELRGMAALYLRRCSVRARASRFDVVSVYLVPGEPPEIELFKDAFSWRSMSGKRRPFGFSGARGMSVPELRKDPVVGRWVIISTDRAKRPSDFLRSKVVQKGGFCPLCPGNESKTPSEVLAYRPERQRQRAEERPGLDGARGAQ